MDKMSSPNSYTAENFLLEYESKRLAIREDGQLDDSTGHNEKRMMITLYLLVKILIGQGLMNLAKTGLKYEIVDSFKR